MAEHQYETMDFTDLEPVSRSVKYKEKQYVLREASADAAAKYRNQGLRGARFSEGKMVGMGDVADLQPYLVSLCLWELVGAAKEDSAETVSAAREKNGTVEKPVDLKVIRTWPERMVKEMFNWVKDVSMLDEEETEEVLNKRLQDTQKKLDEIKAKKREGVLKNSHDATTANSD